MTYILKPNNSAVASDGGSICLMFTVDKHEDFMVRLDKGINSKTRGRVFTTVIKNGEPEPQQMLGSTEEEVLIGQLLISKNCITDNSGERLIDTVITTNKK